jgi:hypothetical protein
LILWLRHSHNSRQVYRLGKPERRCAGGTLQNRKEVHEGKQSCVIVDAIVGANRQISSCGGFALGSYPVPSPAKSIVRFVHPSMVDAAARERRRKMLAATREVFQNSSHAIWGSAILRICHLRQDRSFLLGRICHSNIYGIVFVGYWC